MPLVCVYKSLQCFSFIKDILAVGYGAKKSGTFMESEGLICCWSLKNLEVCSDQPANTFVE